MKDTGCAYCGNEKILDTFGIFIGELPSTNLYLFKEQSHLGRCILAIKGHINDITDLTDEESSAFFLDVKRASQALKDIYNPDKINYGMYNDRGQHLHIHLVPKYYDEFEFGTTFSMNPARIFPSSDELQVEIQKIKEKLALQ